MRFLLLLLCAIFFSACSTSNIRSNKSPEFNEKLNKVYLIIKSANGAKEFSYAFKTSFLKELSQRGISSDYYIPDPLALESDAEVNEKVKAFTPQIVIVMTQTESKSHNSYNSGNSNNINGGTFDIKMFFPGSDKPIWRASLEAYGDFGIEMSVKKSVKSLIEKLRNDNLI